MSASVLISGKLFRSAERRTSRNGSEFMVATLAVVDGSDREFWSVIAFNEHVKDELARLDEGDHVSLQGALKLEIFDSNGSPRIGRKIVADWAMPLRPPGSLVKERKSKTVPKEKEPPPPPDRSRLDRHAGDVVDHFNDGVPF